MAKKTFEYLFCCCILNIFSKSAEQVIRDLLVKTTVLTTKLESQLALFNLLF
jgi:hypothetical protein